MKGHLNPKPASAEDRLILLRWCVKHYSPTHPQSCICASYAAADRRDADRMLRIMTLGCRFCGSNSMYGEVHERDCIYVTDPSARRVWLRKGARVIE